ncbi:ARM REPEAT PROTEIN INTERACTING WITH ABF2 [Striga hermonthica]|uniref:ARM REPEAT PROTEIN INTERACTING WITH ABF2 n=1 Tax=Striga hermonthica TaxID=68872 RepID=A0A9N7R656_STRHE|nr:ARM REPEAT PROTEIN INTERACTING WITH ABF2 [Striga hermonthica]
MENQSDISGRRRREKPSPSPSRRSLKRKLDEDPDGDRPHQDPALEVRAQVEILDSALSPSYKDRLAVKKAIDVLSCFARNGMWPEHQHHIVDAGALPFLVDLLKRYRGVSESWAVSGVIRKAANAITNLAHENGHIKTRVRVEDGIPPLVELLEFADSKVQKAAAGALRTLAFKNDENKNQIVECNALPTLILMMHSEDTAIHYEAVGVIGNLVHSSPNIKREVLAAGALQPVISLLRYDWCTYAKLQGIVGSGRRLHMLSQRRCIQCQDSVNNKCTGEIQAMPEAKAAVKDVELSDLVGPRYVRREDVEGDTTSR